MSANNDGETADAKTRVQDTDPQLKNLHPSPNSNSNSASVSVATKLGVTYGSSDQKGESHEEKENQSQEKSKINESHFSDQVLTTENNVVKNQQFQPPSVCVRDLVVGIDIGSPDDKTEPEKSKTENIINMLESISKGVPMGNQGKREDTHTALPPGVEISSIEGASLKDPHHSAFNHDIEGPLDGTRTKHDSDDDYNDDFHDDDDDDDGNDDEDVHGDNGNDEDENKEEEEEEEEDDDDGDAMDHDLDYDNEQDDGKDQDNGLEGAGITRSPYENMVDFPSCPVETVVYHKEDYQLREKLLKSALMGAVKRLPNNAEAHFHLGLMHMRFGKGDDALKAFEHCRKLLNKQVKVYDSDNVPDHLKQKITRLRSHTTQAAHMAAKNEINSDDRAELLKELQQDLLSSIKLDEYKPDLWNALALLHLTEGGYNGAKDIINSIEESFPDYLDALNNKGLCELGLNNSETATSCFQEILVRNRNHLESLCNYAAILLMHGFFEDAARAYADVIEQSQDGYGLDCAWAGLAIAAAAFGNIDEAVNAASTAEKMTNSINRGKFQTLMCSLLIRKITSKIRLGSEKDLSILSPTGVKSPFEGPISKLRAQSRESSKSSILVALGHALRLRHEYTSEESGNRSFGAEAAERFVEALEKDPNDAAAWSQLALLQMSSGEYTSSRDFCIQACIREKGLVSAWNNLGVSSHLIDEQHDAEKAYEKALSIGMESSQIAGLAGDNSDLDKMYVNASSMLAAAAIWNNLGNLYRQQGNSFNESQQAYEKSLLAGGDSAIVYNNLALLYISATRFDEAEEMLKNALKIDANVECANSNLMKLNLLRKKRNPKRRKSTK